MILDCKVLFVGHDASRTGAPVILLNLLIWLKKHYSLDFIVLLRDGGPLRCDYERIASTYVYSDVVPVSIPSFFWSKKKGGDVSKAQYYRELLEKENISLVYSNTATNGELYELFKELKLPVITHIHELEYVLRVCSSALNLRRVKVITDHFIVASQAVMANLMENHAVPPEKMTLCHDFIHCEDIAKDTFPQDIFCRELNIAVDSFIVCAIGTMDWRKGADLLALLANSVVNKSPDVPIYFIWVGGPLEGDFFDRLMFDVIRLGLQDRIFFPGESGNLGKYYAACDVFTLLSREDPFPLVCLEAAAFGKPIVCFADSGGMPEFVEKDAGFVVPYLNIEAMAERIIELHADCTLRQFLGAQAAVKVRQRHDIAESGRKIMEIMGSLVP